RWIGQSVLPARHQVRGQPDDLSFVADGGIGGAVIGTERPGQVSAEAELSLSLACVIQHVKPMALIPGEQPIPLSGQCQTDGQRTQRSGPGGSKGNGRGGRVHEGQRSMLVRRRWTSMRASSSW